MVQSRKSRATAQAGGGKRSTPGATAPANTGSHLKRGSAARQQATTEAENAAKSGNQPWRYWLLNDSSLDIKTATEDAPKGLPKNCAEIIILDQTLENVVGQYEHNLRIAGKFGNFEACPKEWDNCPLCDNSDKSYYVVFFSVLVLKPWISKDEKKSGNWTKMLLPVKSAQMGKFEEICQMAQDTHGGVLRGTYFYMKRDTSNAQSANIGEPTILDGGMLFDHYSEEELVSEFGAAVEKSPEGKVLKAENADITPFDYDKIFEKPDGDDLRRRHGGGNQAGSSSEAAQEWGDSGAEATAKRTAPRRRPAPAVTTEPEDDLNMGDGDGNPPDKRDPFEGEQG